MADRPRVLVREEIAEAGVDLLRAHFDVDVDSTSDLAAIIGRYDAIVIRSATKLTADLIAAATNLKVIGRAGVGVDNVDVEAATRRGIVVANAPESNIVSAAEHTVGLLVRARAEHPAGARGARRGSLGALEVGRGRARGEDARRARLRADRPAGRPPRARAADARRRLRPVRLRRALHGGGRRAGHARRRARGAPTSSRSTCR